MQYVANSAVITLTENKPQVVLMLFPSAKIPLQLIEFGVFFNGTSGASEPVIVELVKSNRETNSTIGTKNTAVTPVQVRGAGNTGKQSTAIASTVEAAENFSITEPPTVLETMKNFFVPPTSGLLYQAPMGREAEGVPGTTFGLGIRINPEKVASLKVRTYMEFIQGPS